MPFVFYVLIFRTFFMILIHIFYQFTYSASDGLDPVYNDEFFFMRIARSTYDYNFDISHLFLPEHGSSIYYGFFLGLFNNFCFSLELSTRLFNNITFILIMLIVRRYCKLINICKKFTRYTQYFILFSPSLMFFSTKILRDIQICLLVTICFYFLESRKYLLSFLWMIFLGFLRKHLVASLAFSFICKFLSLKFRYTFTFSFLIFCLLFLINIPYLDSLKFNIFMYPMIYIIHLLGLNFLIADANMFIVSFERVIIQRIFAFDTVIPQILLLYYIFKSYKSKKLLLTTKLYFVLNIPYLYLYHQEGYTAARQTIIPFIPIILLQLSYYASCNYRKYFKFSKLNSS